MTANVLSRKTGPPAPPPAWTASSANTIDQAQLQAAIAFARGGAD